ncbi:hypothetical protein F5X68DRAFT_51655 [Plectosphaerella plurivora]|uniref:Uncharacterized protein n=1 Tax=Plectosphaerella plurivora TaxID=936078 RepID=A0A9P8V0M4_9PEZI|nr:hypothetical protein F5X68DRAFT_51655 [Plectosphaerella plurivora]
MDWARNDSRRTDKVNPRGRWHDRHRSPQARERMAAALNGLHSPMSLFNINGFNGQNTNNNSNPFQSGSRRREHQNGQRHYSNPFLPPLNRPEHPEEHREMDSNRQDPEVVHAQLQASSDMDRTKLANSLLKNRLLFIGHSAYNEFENSLRLWCEAVGLSDDEPEPMDWQPEKVLPVHVVFVHCDAANVPVLGPTPAADSAPTSIPTARSDWEELSLII